ncbi:uncharacterized protein LOC142992982, partial [Genypterus blacodes]|uniref:uncharacterized protein LOC142992982 n=1 Tax=Genypterus blacodes TaxID=154954 RepID=UPI003F771FDD
TGGGGEESPSAGAAEEEGGRARGRHGIQPQTQQIHGPGPAPTPGEQPGPVQVLLTPNQEEEEDQATPNQDAALGPNPPPPPYRPSPPRPPLALSITHPCAPFRQGEEGERLGSVRRGEGGGDGREGTGVRLCELLQAGGVSVRPLGKHLAISLPSLPLRLWDTHTTHAEGQKLRPQAHTAHAAHAAHTHLEPSHAHVPRPPSSPSLGACGDGKPRAATCQPPHPYPSPNATHYWQRCGAVPDANTRHWSSWSLDRPDAVVTPYETPPDRCVPIRPPPPPPPSQSCSYSCQSSPGHCNSQHASGLPCDHEEAELSELDSLYQASLQAGRTGCSPSERLISRVGGQTRSKTPNADMERSVYGADCTSTPTYLNKPMVLQDLHFGAEPNDGENLRRIGRSLSGTVVTSRRSRLTATRSFELSSGSGSFWLCLTGVKLPSDQSPSPRH